MGQVYLDGGDQFIEIEHPVCAGQSFRVEHDHILQCLDLDLRVPIFGWSPVVLVYNAGADHHPTGDYISLDKWMEYPTRIADVRKRTRFQMAPVLLRKTHLYCIVVKWFPPLFGGNVDWFYDAGDATYPRGMRISSNDNGATWTDHPTDDHMFAEYGDPYSPPSPPTPPIKNWLITQIWYYTSLDGLVIVVATNVPCHMYMYWTKEPPQKHVVPRLRRGTPFSDTLNYCFVAWHENEQIEPGDTLMHTFIKPNWPICETRWFTFRAKIEGEWATSAAPIFEKHRTETITPLTYGPVIAYLNNRTITQYNILWPPCHDALTGVIENWHADPHYFLSTRTGRPINYTIHRSFLTFDTSGIPPGSSIIGAALSIFLQLYRHNYDPNYPDMCITEGVQHDPVVPADYGDQLPYTTIGGQRDIHEMILGQYNDIPFNADGLAWINPAGLTKLCIRQQMDILDLTYPTGLHWMRYRSAQYEDGYQPLLTVYYVPP